MNSIIAPLFKVVRTLLSRPADIDFFQGWVAFENTRCGRDHFFVGIFVPFGKGESFEGRE